LEEEVLTVERRRKWADGNG